MPINVQCKKIPSRLFSAIALLCFFLALTAWIDDKIDEYDKNVPWEQQNRKMDANYGTHFAVDAGPDYRPIYRTWIVLISGLGFSLTLRRKVFFFSIIPYLLTTPLMYDWVVRTARDLSYNPSYMEESPYLLRMASIYDWSTFAVITLTICAFLSIIIRTLLFRTRPTVNLS